MAKTVANHTAYIRIKSNLSSGPTASATADSASTFLTKVETKAAIMASSKTASSDNEAGAKIETSVSKEDAEGTASKNWLIHFYGVSKSNFWLIYFYGVSKRKFRFR